mmetsp:Transcript_34944/g.76884  ORF Transcript_34944/g.76884 Transcript_34944/m.76884 type:complete len:330 (+) Transcript_34944:425-1414(+)
MRLAGSVDHHLSGLGEGVVVLGAHRRAVGACALDDADVADGGGSELARLQHLRLVGRRRHQIARLAAVADGDVRARLSGGGRAGVRRNQDQRVLRAVEGRPEELRHAGVQLEEAVALLASRHNVLDGAQESARVGDEEGPRLDLKRELAACPLRELLERLLDGRADGLQVGRLLAAHPADLVPAAQVEHAHRRQLLAQAERQARDARPDGRVGARADVRVHARRLEVVFVDDRLHLRHQLVPDAKGGGGPTHVGLARAAGAEARVEAHAELVATRAAAQLAKGTQLAQRARVVFDAHVEKLAEVRCKLLRAKRNALRRDTRSNGAADFV